MAQFARVEVFAADEIAIVHVMNKTVRRWFLLGNDLCRRDLGYESNAEVKTPNLDKLCKESMHLRRMFNPATSCSPTRHALYTGLYPIRSGAFPNHTRVYEGTKRIGKRTGAWMIQQGDNGLDTETLAHTRQGNAKKQGGNTAHANN